MERRPIPFPKVSPMHEVRGSGQRSAGETKRSKSGEIKKKG